MDFIKKYAKEIKTAVMLSMAVAGTTMLGVFDAVSFVEELPVVGTYAKMIVGGLLVAGALLIMNKSL